MDVTDKCRVTTVPCEGVVTCVECSPFDFSDPLFCFCSHSNSEIGQTCHQITIAKCYPKREGSQMVEVLKQYQQDKLTTCLAWSTKTFIESLPYEVVIAAGSIDGKVSIITTDLRENNEVQVVGSHSKSVNAVSFDFDSGSLLASVSDDNKCILWCTQDASKQAEFRLKSAGMDVKFNQQDNTKLLVAERSGLIRFYDLISMNAFMSVECDSGSLLKSIDWSPSDITRLDVLAGHQWLVFDTSKSCLPISQRSLTSNTKDVIMNSGTRLQISSLNANLLAFGCGRGHCVKVISAGESEKQDQVLHVLDNTLGGGFSWHATEPLLMCGGDRCISILSIEAP